MLFEPNSNSVGTGLCNYLEDRTITMRLSSIINEIRFKEIAKMHASGSGLFKLIGSSVIMLAGLLLVFAGVQSHAVEGTLEAPSTDVDFEPLLGENAKELWRGYKEEDWPKSWELKDGVLSRVGDGGDIMTVGEFADFDLRLEWKISPGGNSGIIYRVSTGDKASYVTGIECQVLDDDKHRDGKSTLTSAASLYALYPRSERATAPVGEWNKARVVVRGNHVEHWLNGKKLVDCEIGSEDWNKRLAKSKFADWPKFAKNRTGHIALQDHNDPVWYRNIRIKRLDQAE